MRRAPFHAQACVCDTTEMDRYFVGVAASAAPALLCCFVFFPRCVSVAKEPEWSIVTAAAPNTDESDNF